MYINFSRVTGQNQPDLDTVYLPLGNQNPLLENPAKPLKSKWFFALEPSPHPGFNQGA
jgi:hypothetical protein